MLSDKLLDCGHRRITLSQILLSKRADGSQSGLLLALYLGVDIFRVAELNLGAELKKAGGKMVLGGQGAGVKVDNFLILALVKEVKDID
jgi:hypothetical protein